MALFDRSKATVKYPDIVKALTSVKTESGKTEEQGKSESEKLSASKLVAKINNGKIKLSWTEVEDANRYRVYRYNTKTKKYTRIATVKGTSCTIKNPKKGTYKFIVCAVEKTDDGYKNGYYSKSVKVRIK